MDSVVKRRDDEIFFPVQEVPAENQQLTREISVGDIGFCPEGSLLCVFFGPAADPQKPVAENPVVIVGRTLASPDELRTVAEGSAIRVTAHEPAAAAAPAAAAPAAPAPAVGSGGFGERKLSQAEIDVLVQQLLAAKKKQ